MSPHTKKINDLGQRAINAGKSVKHISFFGIVFLLAIAACIRMMLSSPLSVDTYTHVAIGEYVIQTQAVPTHSSVSYKTTDPSLEWLSHSWLADTLLFLGQSTSFQIGILIIMIPLLFVSLYLGYLTIRTRHDTALTATVFSVTLLITAGFFKYHPFIFMIPLQLVLIFILDRWQNGNNKALLFIPVLFTVWANIAGGYIIVPAIFIILTAVTSPGIWGKNNKNTGIRSVWLLALALAAGIGTSLINPYGVRIWMYWLTVIAVIYQNRAFSTLSGALSLYNQTHTHQAYSSLFLTLFTGYILTIAITIISRLVRQGKPFLMACIPFLPYLVATTLGALWVRFIPFSLFSALPLSIFLFTGGGKKNIWRSSGLIGCSLVSAAVSLVIIFTPPVTPRPTAPSDMMTALRSMEIKENILTTYDNTGYVMYAMPEYKVLLDAQDDLLDDGALITNYQPVGNFASAFKEIRTAQNIHTAIVSRNISGLSQTLSQDDQWALLYFDETGAIFADRASLSPETLSAHELLHVNLDTNLGFSPDMATQSARELESFLKRYPQNTFARGQLATIYRITKQFDRAAEHLSFIPENERSFTTYTELGRLEAARGKCKSAEHYFLRALALRDERNYSRTVLDIAVLYAGCFNDKQKARHFFKRYNSFLVTANEREKLNMLTQQFNIDLSD